VWWWWVCGLVGNQGYHKNDRRAFFVPPAFYPIQWFSCCVSFVDLFFLLPISAFLLSLMCFPSPDFRQIPADSSEARFQHIVGELRSFLTGTVGFAATSVEFIPVSGLHGWNLKSPPPPPPASPAAAAPPKAKRLRHRA